MTRLRTSGLIIVVILSIATASTLAQESPESSSLSGTVRDSRSAPVPNATIHLQSKDADRAYAASTDAHGLYRFHVLPAGVYVLKTQAAGYLPTDVTSVFIRDGESKTVDLTVQPSGNSSSASPEFYDEPKFTVAGVTDTTNLGGHGSDVVVRTRDKLAKDTAALGNAPNATRSPESIAAENSLREELRRDPSSFDANHRLGQLLLNAGEFREALGYLDRAARVKPNDYQNSYDQALANAEAGNYDRARSIAQTLTKSQEQPDTHHLLADIAEKSGDPLEAVRQYQRAAELDPNENYLFDWGAELLLHHAPEPALQVFNKGSRLFPRSERMWMGLGAASYAHGSYEDAVREICNASDLNPEDPAPYVFLGRMQHAEKKPSEQVLDKLHRFVTLHPDSAEANYYYGLALRKSRTDPNERSGADIESLFTKALTVNPNFAAAHLQLGILHSDRGDYAAATISYERALTLDPQMEEAHYRLAQAYRQAGKPEQAKEELRLYDECVKQSAKRLEQERHEIRQFVYTLRDQSPASAQ